MTSAPGTVVGREAELDRITERLRAPDELRVVLLEGERGIGETTLWEEGVRIARDLAHQVLACP